MISLRYHIVSLVAVFLALALGIVVGSTVLQEGTVSVLRATSDQVREQSERNSRENVALKQEISRLQGPVWDQARKQLSRPGYSPRQVQVLFLHTTYHGADCDCGEIPELAPCGTCRGEDAHHPECPEIRRAS